MIFQCERCNDLFPCEQELKNHFMAVKSCDLQRPAPTDGITETIAKRLRSRKKTHREQSEEERWKEIYGILFPNQIIPSACKFAFVLSESPSVFGPSCKINYLFFMHTSDTYNSQTSSHLQTKSHNHQSLQSSLATRNTLAKNCHEYSEGLSKPL